MNNGTKKKEKKNIDLSSKKESLKECNTNSDVPTTSSYDNKERNNKIKRKHTKHEKNKKAKDKNIKEDKNNEKIIQNTKKEVKFGNIEFINVECWKEINLKLTADENFDEIIELTTGKDGKKNKNISCTCIVL